MTGKITGVKTWQLAIRWLWKNLNILLMLHAILLPVFGPWLNSGYAGLQPQHDHIYFGEVDPDHHQPHETQHKARGHHHHPEKEPEVPINAVVSLPDRNMTGQGVNLFVDVNSPVLWARHDTLFFLLETVAYRVQGIKMPPLEMPPRTIRKLFVAGF